VSAFGLARATSLALAVALVGCGEEATTGTTGTTGTTATTSPTTTPAMTPEQMPAEMVDPDGTRWIKTGIAKIDPNGPPIRHQIPESPKSGRDLVGTLTVADLATKIRPEMESNGAQYVMSMEDTMKLAQAMKDLRGQDLQTEGEAPTGLGPTDLEGRVLGIYDGESRTRVTSNAFPWNTIAFIGGGSGANTCTGFKLINHYTIVTAAHCLKDNNDNWRPKPDITFAAGTVGPGLTMPGSCYARTVPLDWNDDSDSDLDYGIIKLRGSGANCDPNAYLWTGYMGTQSVGGCTTGLGLNNAGYPAKNPQWGAAPPGNWPEPSMFSDYRGNAWTSCITYPSAIWFYNDFSPGMSGGPLWRLDPTTNNRYVRGITNASSQGLFQDTNRALRFDSGVLSFLKANAGS